VRDAAGHSVKRDVHKSGASAFLVDKGNHRHFMAKEIHEQPEVVRRTLSRYLDMTRETVAMPDLGVDLERASRVTIAACGTAYYAGMVGKYWIEQLARIPVDIDVASEWRYRDAPLAQGDLSIVISQSGETADTLATLRYCQANAQRVCAVVNVDTSTIAREADVVLPTLAGPEIGVASTKAFTCQLAVLACLAVAMGRAHGLVAIEQERELVRALVEVPRHMATILAAERQCERLAHTLASARDVLYIGRGINFPLALEGALKLKEISYIHAEGYAAGELKHGPIALINEDVPIVVVTPHDGLFEKTVSNMQEAAARGGRIMMISNAAPDTVGCHVDAHISMPDVHPFGAPLAYVLPLQLLAYHTAVRLGTDVDQPRNLAKSVTVE
jgi:glucosamine--fructose-6-phosphate aminotransferase (isomerizing)